MPRFSVTFWLVAAFASAAAGLFYNGLFENGQPLVGAIYGLFIGLSAILYDRGLIFPETRKRLRSFPTLSYLLAAEAMLFVVILLASAAGGVVVWSMGLVGDSFLDAVTPSFSAVVYSLTVSAVFVFVLRMRDLLGAEVFANLLVSRYNRPVSEERIFLFVDVVGSTAYAQKHGDLAAQALLGAIFNAIAEPVRRHRGQVDDYVGDLVIITWPLERGIERARCIDCLFAILDALARNPSIWQRRFEQVPNVRMAMHGGSVVTAEVGVDRHKIAYFGDVVNTTARLEALCRTLNRQVLVSNDLLARLPGLPAGVTKEPLGHHVLRGRDQRLGVVSLSQEAAPFPV